MALFHFYSARIAVDGRPARRGRPILEACALVALCLHTGVAAAQTGTWTSPSSGYIYDAANRSVRSLSGFIGSALLGPSVAGGIDWISIAPNQKSALTYQNGSQVWIPDLSAAGTSQALTRIPLAQQAFWAADASQAVILAAGAQLIWLNNFNSGPVPVSTWNLESSSQASSASSGDEAEARRIGRPRTSAVWSLLAADSHADRVLLALHSGDAWQIWLASSTVPPQFIPFSGRPVAAAFSPGAGGVFVADAVGHQIIQIQNLDTTPTFATVVSSEASVNDPAAMVLSADGNRLFLADHAGSVIRLFDLSAGSAGNMVPVTELPAGVPPVSLTAFASDLFVINAAAQTGGQPIYFLDTGVPSGVSFVPGEQ